MTVRKIAFAAAGLLLWSCHKETDFTQIDAAIKKYDTVDFSALKNTYVGYRGRDETANLMLMVAKFDLSCPAYIATVYPKTKELTAVDEHLIKESDKDCQPYFTKQQIAQYSKAFLKYDAKVIGVDASGNVYINPAAQDAPNLLRKVDGSTPKDLADFKKYKGNWYLRKTE
ncbi:hypothetical protein HYN48_08665 [Flavobacterium magnum]|uniref:Uncharacterized protein n=1 Tax=Flavobacterium magnum TaxID=2162713 RepID=A0A2S0REP1_9FLAO|nr:hypothetical protein [Flavobacterium magnum]AWA30146.1 hypothetical protein HYN48_08665 [Flavobacterium magnum]